MTSESVDETQTEVADLTALPRNRTEGDMPKIAIVTGNCDALECLPRKLGISDSEFTTDSEDGRIHLYAANGANRMASNNASISSASTLWGNLDKLKQYDIMFNSCECSENAAQKPQAYMDNMKAYADLGGRVFLSHYQTIGKQPDVMTKLYDELFHWMAAEGIAEWITFKSALSQAKL